MRLQRWETVMLRRWETEITTVGNCEVTTVGNCEVTTVGNCEVTTVGNCEFTTVGNCEVTTAGNCEVTTVGNCEVTTVGNCDVTTVGNCEVTTVGNCDITTVGNCEVTTDQHNASRNSIQFFLTGKNIVVVVVIQRKWNMKASVMPVIIMTTGVISKSLRSVPEQHMGKTRNYGTVKNSHIGHSPHSKESGNVKLQTIFQG